MSKELEKGVKRSPIIVIGVPDGALEIPFSPGGTKMVIPKEKLKQQSGNRLN